MPVDDPARKLKIYPCRICSHSKRADVRPSWDKECFLVLTVDDVKREEVFAEAILRLHHAEMIDQPIEGPLRPCERSMRFYGQTLAKTNVDFDQYRIR
jgi:hypothetical protein